MSNSHHSNSDWKTRLVEGHFPDRSFDVEFWQEQGDEAIFFRSLGDGGIIRGSQEWQKTHITKNCYSP
jgi:hypothetical protein